MNTENLVITQARLASLIGGMGYPNPEDDTPIRRWPHGPGPVSQSWLDYLSWVAINPQPLPPGERFAAAIAAVFIERAYRVNELSSLLTDRQRALGSAFAAEFDEAGGWCGTMSRWEMLQKILSWLRHHQPSPPPPDPWWSQGLAENEIIIVGGRVAYAAENFGNHVLRSAMQNVGGNLMQQGLKAGQATSNRQTIPASEQV
jgi:hypothetical protein